MSDNAQDDQLKVMHIIGDLDRAGAQEVVRTLIEYLALDDCNPVVCTLRDGPLRSDIEQLGVPVEVIGGRKHSLLNGPGFVTDMRRIQSEIVKTINKHSINIIQTHLLGVLDFLTLTLRRQTTLQTILWTVHNVNFLPDPKQKDVLSKIRPLGHQMLYRLTSTQVDGFIAISEEVKEAMLQQLGVSQDKIITINNGVDVKRYERVGYKEKLCRELELPSDSVLAIVVGRLTEQKGHCYLIEATPQIINKHPKLHFLFVGEGELKNRLQQQVRQLNVQQNVHFLGNRGDVPDLLASVDLFVLPSLWEGLAMALLEAMAAGKPIVATAVSGTNQVMVPNETGLVVPAGNSQSLFEAINYILSYPAKAQLMGQTAKRQVETNYSARKQAKEHLALYHRLLA